MSTFEPIPLGHDYWLGADERNWIVYRLRVRKTGEGRGKAIRDKRDGTVRREVIGYYARLPHALNSLADRRIRETRWQDWADVMQTLAEQLDKVTTAKQVLEWERGRAGR